MAQNRKKGMAKRALSVSLVAAMLATSNTPAWASGFMNESEDGVQAFLNEISVEEVGNDDLHLQAVDALGGTVKVIDTATKNEVSGTVTFGQSLEASISDDVAVAYKWQNKAAGADWVDISGATSATYTVASTNVGKDLRVVVYPSTAADDEIEQAGKTAEFKVKAKSISAGQVEITLSSDSRNDGEQDPSVTAVIVDDDENGTFDESAVANTGYSVTYGDNNTWGPEAGVVWVTFKPESGYEGTFMKAFAIVAPDAETGFYEITTPVETGETFKNYTYTGSQIVPTVEKVVRVKDNIKITDYTVLPLSAIDAGTTELDVCVEVAGTVHKAKNQAKIVAKELSDVGFTVKGLDKAAKAASEDEAFAEIQLYDNAIGTSSDKALAKTATMGTTVGGTEDYAVKIENFDKVNYPVTVTLTGVNNYTGTIVTTFQRGGADLSSKTYADAIDAYLTTSATDVKYTGFDQNPIKKNQPIEIQLDPSDDSEKVKLYEGADFTAEVVGGDCTNAGTIKIKFTGKGEYTGVYTSSAFAIGKADITAGSVIVEGSTANPLVYNPAIGGNAAIAKYHPTVNLVLNKGTKNEYVLKAGKDYWVTREADAAAVSGGANAKVTLSLDTAATKEHSASKNFEGAKDNSTGSITDLVYELKPISFADANKDLVITAADAQFTGAPVLPEVKVTYKGTVVDPAYYTVAGSNNVAIGKNAKITVAPRNAENLADYLTSLNLTEQQKAKYDGLFDSGTNRAVKFSIVANATSLTGGKIIDPSNQNTILPNVPYDATAAESENGIILPASKYAVLDKDGNVISSNYYDVKFSNNKKAGTATITVTGKNGYTGTLSSTYVIAAKGLPVGIVKLIGTPSKEYTGKGVELVKGEDYQVNTAVAELVEGTDFILEYENNVNVGTAAKAIVKGINNYYGSYSLTFEIKGAVIAEKDIKLGSTEYAGGIQINPDVEIALPSGELLKAGTDYTVEYVGTAVNVGDKAKVVITYSDSPVKVDPDSVSVVNYTVTKRNLESCTADIVDGKLVIKNGEITVPETEYDVTEADGTFTATAKEDGNYTGTIAAKATAAPAATQAKVAAKTTSTVTISWDAVEGAGGYTIWYHSEKDTKNARKVITGGDVTSWTQKGLAAGTKYFYTVKAWVKDAEGKYVFGEETSYVRGTTMPMKAKITKVTAANGMIKVALADAAAGAEKYSMCYSKSSDFASFKVGVRTSYTTRTFTNALTKGTYYVRVKSYRDLNGGKRIYGAWSNTVKVVVK